MLTEELLNKSELHVKKKFPNGIKGVVSEIHICTQYGWIERPFACRSKVQSEINRRTAVNTIAALRQHGLLIGVVQVTSGWIVEGSLNGPAVDPQHHPARKEILMFNGTGPHGCRVRVYEVTKHGRRKLPSRLVGTFDQYPSEQGRE